ncbi:hypothetical protein BDW59DRAFT_7507 [Aspergillus cavernicola]|uniref:Myb-like domain-containing protein n=1 Tax=Aspergillus cavernicola TaxID=176166 RepID=A0ABR4ITS5_9EURO
MLSHSGSPLRRNVTSKSQASMANSPSRKRVTRSRSREVEATRVSRNKTSYSQSQRGQSKGKSLAPVVEESPLRTLRGPTARYGSAVIPESPEDAANISGTTILPSDPETDPDSEMMLEALPDLEREAKSVLGFLAPSSASPVTIVNKAKLLSDPKNTQSKRLRRLMINLTAEFNLFGNQTYIDADGTSRMFSSFLVGRRVVFQDWSPDPILHLANCARFALEILLAGTSASSQRQAIRNIENLFPSPFMTGLVQAGHGVTPGASALESDTFDLALEIRTQSLILQLEEHEHDPRFSPMVAIKLCFFTGSNRKSPLRGFNLPDFGGINGTLPGHYRDIVQNRFNDILISEIDDKMIDVEELKGAYRWQRFVLRAAQWIRKRTDEIAAALENHISAQDVHDAFFTSKHPSFASTLGGSEAEPSGELEDVEHETTQQATVEQETTALEAQQHQELESRTDRKDTGRRRSSKRSAFMDPHSMQRLVQRQEQRRSGSEVLDNRHRPGIARPVSQIVSEQSATQRRQTSEALSSSRPTRQDDIPPSGDASLTLLSDEPEFTIDDDLHSDFESAGTRIERSHSPPVPVRHRDMALARREVTSLDPRTSIDNLWKAAKTGEFPQSFTGPSRFIDRQQQARRVSPIGESVSQSADKRIADSASRKRARLESEPEFEAGSDFFDSDSRLVDTDARRAEKPKQPRSKRRRLEDAWELQEDTNATVDANEEIDAADDVPRGEPRRTSRPSARYSSSMSSSKPKQPWTEAEDKRLKRLMREHGTSWALIERQNLAQAAEEGEVQIKRGNNMQVQFKDRARNLKIAYLRDGRTLPRYLESVTVKQSDYDKLEKQGIIVDRRR